MARRAWRRSPASSKRRRSWLSVLRIDGDECQVGAAGVLAFASENILRENLHADFHRCSKDAVHAGLQDDPFADVDRKAEIHVIDRGGDGGAVAVTRGSKSAGDVHQVHHASAEHFA
jgi:hypothetical protein